MNVVDDRSGGGSGAGGTRGSGARARAVLGMVSLLVLGAVIGIAIDRHLTPSRLHSPAAALHDLTMSSLEERLDLTADQRRRIDAIVADHHDGLRHAWQMVHARLGAVVDTVHQEIEAVLTAEQRTEFREWLRGDAVDE